MSICEHRFLWQLVIACPCPKMVVSNRLLRSREFRSVVYIFNMYLLRKTEFTHVHAQIMRAPRQHRDNTFGLGEFQHQPPKAPRHQRWVRYPSVLRPLLGTGWRIAAAPQIAKSQPPKQRRPETNTCHRARHRRCSSAVLLQLGAQKEKPRIVNHLGCETVAETAQCYPGMSHV